MFPIFVKIPVRLLVRILYIVLCVLFFATIVFAVFYLCTGFKGLVSWYFNLNDCFYNSNTWGTHFFTPAIKSDGNMYSVIAIAISLSGLYYLWKKRTENKNVVLQPVILVTTLTDIVLAAVCMITAFCLWWYGNNTALPAYDEIFSAQNVAGIHPFQAISYYMLPNNHIFFNLLNNLIFHYAKDKVVTGRIISLFAYEGVIVSLFFWLKCITKNRWFALFASCTLCFQWIVWGFSYQARGYELYLLAEWGMLISLLSYLSYNNKKWLFVNVFCCVVGYYCIPSFMYFHISQLVFAAVYHLCRRKGAAAFWKSQMVIILLVFILYTPLLCFSGIDAVIKNKYVNPMEHHLVNFPEWMFTILIYFINHVFSITKFYDNKVVYLLLLLPLPTLLAKKNNSLVFLTGCFYFTSWIVFFILTMFMKRIPFERNLIGNYSLTLMAVLLMMYWLPGIFLKRWPGKIIQWLTVTASLLICIHSTIHKKDLLIEKMLYEYSVNEVYTEIEGQLIANIPKGSSVGFSDEDFYCEYICMKHSYIVANSNCSTGEEDYYVKKDYESLPVNSKYLLTGHANEYEIYKRIAPVAMQGH